MSLEFNGTPVKRQGTIRMALSDKSDWVSVPNGHESWKSVTVRCEQTRNNRVDAVTVVIMIEVRKATD
jgi:hypothetical protein